MPKYEFAALARRAKFAIAGLLICLSSLLSSAAMAADLPLKMNRTMTAAPPMSVGNPSSRSTCPDCIRACQ
jgi:hypothetical protein